MVPLQDQLHPVLLPDLKCPSQLSPNIPIHTHVYSPQRQPLLPVKLAPACPQSGITNSQLHHFPSTCAILTPPS